MNFKWTIKSNESKIVIGLNCRRQILIRKLLDSKLSYMLVRLIFCYLNESCIFSIITENRCQNILLESAEYVYVWYGSYKIYDINEMLTFYWGNISLIKSSLSYWVLIDCISIARCKHTFSLIYKDFLSSS